MKVEDFSSSNQPNPVHFVAESRYLKTQPFTHPEDQIFTGKAWEDWLEGIEIEFRNFRITDPIDKKDAMIIYGGKEIARLDKSLPNQVADEEQPALDDYMKLRNK
ncbi:hypothetical protein LOTGIDRAFT_163639 [Lottia gigantea]|uniref:Uncharacterized protein n=1 Tax=Lottia gigantea TaxID=225164 RepID=V4A242_LOTGI|nr:hypothetical protein LOTGIDRAFT_163639 [Lottia gigantea]ESO90757.1 hypothetical protein LOTGIDRAFT_163639 [Lottia gigantea]